MLLNAEVFDGYLLIKHIHTVISIIFLIIAIWLLIRSVRGIVKKRHLQEVRQILILRIYHQPIFTIDFWTDSLLQS